MKIFNRISVSEIIKNHFQSFYDYSILKTKKLNVTPINDKLIFLGLPLIISFFLIITENFLNQNWVSIILSCLSIFTGLLFGLLPLIFQLTDSLKKDFTIIQKNEKNDIIKSQAYESTKMKLIISKELFINICFEILVSIFSIISILLTCFKPNLLVTLLKPNSYYNLIKMTYTITTNFISYFSMILFLLTLMMILKRFYLLYIEQTKEINLLD